MAKTDFLRRLSERQLLRAFEKANHAYLTAHAWMVALRCELERRENAVS